MTPEEAVRERLLSIAAVTAIVGSRVHQLVLPQEPTLPAIRVQLIDDVPSYHLRGENGLVPSRVQVDSYAGIASGQDPYARAGALASAVEGNWEGGSPSPPSGLSGWRGSLGGSPPSFYIGFAKRVDRAATFEAAPVSMVRIRLDYIVWWKLLA